MAIYLDGNAGAPLRAEAKDAMAQLLPRLTGNPSSLHSFGRTIRAALESARGQVAGLLGASSEEIVFTSGGTEADRIGVLSLAARLPGQKILVSATAHAAVSRLASWLHSQGHEVERIPCDKSGLLDMDWLKKNCRNSVVAVELVNHETGVMQPVSDIADMVRQSDGLSHCDAVAALGKVRFSPAGLGVDTLAVSSHKIGGPAGVGVVWGRQGEVEDPAGAGHQERERRAGTENTLGIVGFGAAAEATAASFDEEVAVMTRLGELLSQQANQTLGATINGSQAPRLPTTVNMHLPGAAADVVVTALDLEGIAISAGAACSSGKVEPSPVLLAMGIAPEAATECIRVSLHWDSSEQDIHALLAAMPDILARARQFG